MVKDGIIEPHPDCDPEIDYNCRLRRAESTSKEHKDEPAQQEQGYGNPLPEHVAPEYPVPRFEDFLRGYMDGYKKWEEKTEQNLQIKSCLYKFSTSLGLCKRRNSGSLKNHFCIDGLETID